MEKGFFNRIQKSPTPMTTRSGRVVSKPRPPVIDDHAIFPALPYGGKSAPTVSNTPYNFEIPNFSQDLQTSVDDLGSSPSSAAAISSVDATALDGLSPALQTHVVGSEVPTELGPAVALPGSVAAQPLQTWRSLFNKKPRNAGRACPTFRYIIFRPVHLSVAHVSECLFPTPIPEKDTSHLDTIKHAYLKSRLKNQNIETKQHEPKSENVDSNINVGGRRIVAYLRRLKTNPSSTHL